MAICDGTQTFDLVLYVKHTADRDLPKIGFPEKIPPIRAALFSKSITLIVTKLHRVRLSDLVLISRCWKQAAVAITSLDRDTALAFCGWRGIEDRFTMAFSFTL